MNLNEDDFIIEWPAGKPYAFCLDCKTLSRSRHCPKCGSHTHTFETEHERIVAYNAWIDEEINGLMRLKIRDD